MTFKEFCMQQFGTETPDSSTVGLNDLRLAWGMEAKSLDDKGYSECGEAGKKGEQVVVWSYALLSNAFDTIFIESTLEKLDVRINRMLRNRKGMQAKGVDYSMADMFKQFKYSKVKIALQPLPGDELRDE